jgi:hypothetical protein
MSTKRHPKGRPEVVTLHLSKGEKAVLRARAGTDGMSMSAVLRQLIREAHAARMRYGRNSMVTEPASWDSGEDSDA